MSGHLNHLSGEKMAIPVEGGVEEQMDVSNEDPPSYVSINSKGPGRPIRIRLDELEQLRSQYNGGKPIGHNTHSNQYGIEDGPESFLDKKTGSAFTLDSNVQNDVDNIDDKECAEIQDQELNAKIDSAKLASQIDINEENRAQIDASFLSQLTVVSLGEKSMLNKPETWKTPPKKRYQLSQNGTKKNVGTKKNSPGKVDSSLKLVKRPMPYPKWMNLPVKDIIGRPFADKDGNMHQWELQLVRVQLNAACKNVDSMQLTDVQNADSNIFLDGSIDRPPDESVHGGDNHSTTEAVHDVAHTQPSTSNHYNVGNNVQGSYQDATRGIMSAPNIYGGSTDQPLDLTVEKPLDLSLKNNIESKMDDFPSNLEDKEVDLVMEDAAPSEMRAEPSITGYRTQCSSVLSNFDKESLQGDETFDSLTDPCSGETDHQNIGDGNLPSLGKLTLENSCQSQGCTVVQDSAVQEAMSGNVLCKDQTVNGKQRILNLLARGQVTLEQLFAQYQKNQVQKTASAVLSKTGPKQEPRMNQAQPPQPRMVDPNVPRELAMPNLCSLELANNEGRILVKAEEVMRNRLKQKILQKNSMQEND